MGFRNEWPKGIEMASKPMKKNGHPHQSSEQCKPKLHRNSILLQSECQSARKETASVDQREPSCAGGNVNLVQPLWKLVWRFLKSLEVDLLWGPVIPLMGIYPKTPNQHSHGDSSTLMFIAAQFTIAKLWHRRRCSSRDKQIRKMWYIYTIELFSAVTKTEVISFVGK